MLWFVNETVAIDNKNARALSLWLCQEKMVVWKRTSFPGQTQLNREIRALRSYISHNCPNSTSKSVFHLSMERELLLLLTQIWVINPASNFHPVWSRSTSSERSWASIITRTGQQQRQQNRGSNVETQKSSDTLSPRVWYLYHWLGLGGVRREVGAASDRYR